MNPVAPIYVGQLQNGVVWIRVEGKGSFQNSHGMKEFAKLMITRGAKQFVIDLENCPECINNEPIIKPGSTGK